jgi:hypothetical protein
VLFAALCVPVSAAGLNGSGDGSGYSNPDLGDDPTLVCTACVAGAPAENDTPLFDFDWSLGLRGSATESGGTTRYRVLALPSLSLKQQTVRGGYDLSIGGELSKTADGEARVDALDADVGGTYELDSVTTLAGQGTLSVSQDDPRSSADYASNVASAPIVVTGTGEVSVTRDLGLFDLELRGKAARTGYGETVYDDTSTTDNSFQNTTRYGVGGRIAVKVTPGLTAFVDGDAMVDQYDAASPSLGVKLDGTTYEARAGLTFKLRETLELEGSAGLAYRDFKDAGVADFTAAIYGAKLVFVPDETVSLTGELTTTVSAPGTTASASGKVEYAATGSAAVQVSPWLRLRAKAGWSYSETLGADSTEQTANAGAGADYLLSAMTDLTADYTFTRSLTGTGTETDEHVVALGVTFHR